jgi:hypothetical protein
MGRGHQVEVWRKRKEEKQTNVARFKARAGDPELLVAPLTNRYGLGVPGEDSPVPTGLLHAPRSEA